MFFLASIIQALSCSAFYSFSEKFDLNLLIKLWVSIILVIITGTSFFVNRQFRINQNYLLLSLTPIVLLGVCFIIYHQLIPSFWNFALASIILWVVLISIGITKLKSKYLKLIITIPLLILFVALVFKIRHPWLYTSTLIGLVAYSCTLLYTITKDALKISSKTM